jgi:hypothetical protein
MLLAGFGTVEEEFEKEGIGTKSLKKATTFPKPRGCWWKNLW